MLIRCLLVIIFFLHPTQLFAWGVNAHTISARIAWNRMNQDTRREVERLLILNQHHINTLYADSLSKRIYMQALPSDLNLFEKAVIHADLIRTKGTATYHYSNVPIQYNSSNYLTEDFSKFDQDNLHIISKIKEFERIFKDRSRTDKDRSDALLFLIHLVQDLSQPLHVGDNHDKGGNTTQLRFIKKNGKRIGTNLHAVWDYVMLDSLGDFNAQHEVIAELDTEENWSRWGSGGVDRWAVESFKLAKTAYRNPLRPLINERGDIEDYRIFISGEDISDEYVLKNLPILIQQVCKSGHRLAFMLNSKDPL